VLSRTTLIIRTVDQSKLLGLLDNGEFGAWSKGLHAIAQINSLKRPNKSAVVAFLFRVSRKLITPCRTQDETDGARKSNVNTSPLGALSSSSGMKAHARTTFPQVSRFMPTLVTLILPSRS
jgi:hypothetical protein